MENFRIVAKDNIIEILNEIYFCRNANNFPEILIELCRDSFSTRLCLNQDNFLLKRNEKYICNLKFYFRYYYKKLYSFYIELNTLYLSELNSCISEITYLTKKQFINSIKNLLIELEHYLIKI